MAITYEDAAAKLHEWTDNPALRNHARGSRPRCGGRRTAMVPARPMRLGGP